MPSASPFARNTARHRSRSHSVYCNSSSNLGAIVTCPPFSALHRSTKRLPRSPRRILRGLDRDREARMLPECEVQPLEKTAFRFGVPDPFAKVLARRHERQRRESVAVHVRRKEILHLVHALALRRGWLSRLR